MTAGNASGINDGAAAMLVLSRERAGKKVGDVDLVESNEAFAAQSIAVVRELGLDPERVNVNGGAWPAFVFPGALLESVESSGSTAGNAEWTQRRR